MKMEPEEGKPTRATHEILRNILNIAGNNFACEPLDCFCGSVMDEHGELDEQATCVVCEAWEAIKRDEASTQPIPAPEERTPHDCERELDKAKATNAAPDDFKAQDGTLWQCSCGKVYVHTCDEAEGCEWTETEDHTEASSLGTDLREEAKRLGDLVEVADSLEISDPRAAGIVRQALNLLVKDGCLTCKNSYSRGYRAGHKAGVSEWEVPDERG